MTIHLSPTEASASALLVALWRRLWFMHSSQLFADLLAKSNT